MDAQAVLQLQYETQYFGFHPRTILDIVYNVFYENISLCLSDLKQHMIQKFSRIQPPYVIQTQTDSILRSLIRACDKAVDKLEVFLNLNVFSIPKHVVLPEDMIHIKCPCTKDDDAKLDKEIEELKRKILEEKAKKFSLKAKIQEQKQVKNYLMNLQNELQTLLTVASQEGVNEENIESLYGALLELLNFDTFCFDSDH